VEASGAADELLPSTPRSSRLDLADVLGGEVLAQEGQPLLLLVHFADRTGGPQRSRGAGANRWRLDKLTFSASSVAAATRVAAALRAALQAPAFARPRRLLVLVSPAAGAGRGREVWAREAAPVLAAAGVECRVLLTQRRGDAADAAAALLAPPPKPGEAADARACRACDVDGVLAVGGDGTLGEVLNGLMRKDGGAGAAALRALRIGVIPAGSTDAVACTLLGTRDAATAAAHCALGGCQPMDCLRLDGADGAQRYATNFCSYGFFGQVIALSESLRFLGPARYGAAGAAAFAQHGLFSGQLEYLAAEGPPGVDPLLAAQQEEDRRRLRRRRGSTEAGKAAATPLPQPAQQPPAAAAAQSPPAASVWDGLWSAFGGGVEEGPASSGPGSSGSGEGGPSCNANEAASGFASPEHTLDAAEAAALRAAVAAAAELRSPSPPPLPPPPPPPRWRALAGPFHVVTGAVIACRADAAPNGIAPRAALADGAVDLFVIRSCSHLDYLQHLLRLSTPRLGDHLDMPFVTAVKATAFRYAPAPGRPHGFWNVDGELLSGAHSVRVTVLPSLLRMFAFPPDG